MTCCREYAGPHQRDIGRALIDAALPLCGAATSSRPVHCCLLAIAEQSYRPMMVAWRSCRRCTGRAG